MVSATDNQPRRARFNWVDSFLTAIRVGAVVFIAIGLIGSAINFSNGDGPSAEAWRDLLVSGIAQGAMYGLIALGYSMVYGVLGFINFAHGEVFMAGAMTSYFMASYFLETGLWVDQFVLAIIFTVLAAMLTSTLVAVLVEKIAYRPLRHAPRLIPLITSIGVSFFLQYSAAFLFGVANKSVPQPPAWLLDKVDVFGLSWLRIEATKLLVIVVAVISMAALYFFVEKTRTGRSMRAVAEDKEIAALMGINVDRTIVTTFAVGGAMAGVAGTLWALLFRGVSFDTGFLPGIKAFTAAVLGGIGNLAGAMLGGLVLGLFEGLGPLLILDGFGGVNDSLDIPGVSQLKDVVAFAALVLVLVFRPSGLLGERLSEDERA
ncbi:MAG: branched-chain amino acid ABC transporter permease [bacterium]|nr:branched-chain amino acid ABC transporter permease [bacterium]